MFSLSGSKPRIVARDLGEYVVLLDGVVGVEELATSRTAALGESAFCTKPVDDSCGLVVLDTAVATSNLSLRTCVSLLTPAGSCCD